MSKENLQQLFAMSDLIDRFDHYIEAHADFLPGRRDLLLRNMQALALVNNQPSILSKEHIHDLANASLDGFEQNAVTWNIDIDTSTCKRIIIISSRGEHKTISLTALLMMMCTIGNC